MTLLEEFGAWAASPMPADFPREKLADHVMDTVGAWIAGSRTADGQALAKFAARLGSDAPIDRVLLRVGQTRLTEIDDIHLPTVTTPGSVVVPTAVTMAGALSCDDPARFAAALRAGYGAMTWLAALTAGAEIFYRGIWPTYYATPVGAAAVTAVLHGLDAGGIADALAIALTASSAGIGSLPGLTPRWMLIGQAARAGCVAALAAADGYAGDRTLLDGDWLARVHGLTIDRQAVAIPADGNVGGLSTKPVCAARQTQAAIAAFRHLLAQGVDPAAIDAVHVFVPPNFTSVIGHSWVGPRMRRVSSIAYVLGLAAFHPAALLDVAREETLMDAPFVDFLERVSASGDPSLLVHYPRHWPARVELRLRDGRILAHTVVAAPGDPDAPSSRAVLREKFMRLTGGDDGLAALALGAVDDAGKLKGLTK